MGLLTWGTAPVIGSPSDIFTSCVAPAHKAVHHGMEIGTYRKIHVGLGRVQPVPTTHTTPPQRPRKRSLEEGDKYLCPH